MQGGSGPLQFYQIDQVTGHDQQEVSWISPANAYRLKRTLDVEPAWIQLAFEQSYLTLLMLQYRQVWQQASPILLAFQAAQISLHQTRALR